MRALFINRLTGPECLSRQPLGILCLSAALKRDGHEVFLADACRPHDVQAAILRHNPKALLYSVRTGYHRFYIELNRRLKRDFPSLLSIFGGPHATFHPEMIAGDEAIDAVCVGEGDLALGDFFARLQVEEDWEATPNFWTRRAGELRRNPVRPLAPELDALPLPDRDMLAVYPAVRAAPVRSFIASRGCPFDCTYCYNPAWARLYEGKGARVRLTSPQRLVEEMAREHANQPFVAAHFEDDAFGVSPRWLEEFSGLYRREVGLPFSCNMRIEMVSEQACDQLAAAGCMMVLIGVESGDERVRGELLARHYSDDLIRVAVARLKKAGLAVGTLNMLGLPKTTLAQDLKTLDLNCELRPDYPDCTIFQPYPGTQLGRIAAEAGLFSGNADELGNFYEATSLRLPHRREVANLLELFFLVARFPRLRPLVPGLIRLPLHPLYHLLNLALKTYSLTREIYRVPLRPRLLRYARQLLGRP